MNQMLELSTITYIAALLRCVRLFAILARTLCLKFFDPEYLEVALAISFSKEGLPQLQISSLVLVHLAALLY